MPRYKLTQKWKNDKEQQRRWELPPGSHVWCYLRHSPGDNQTIDSQKSGMLQWCEQNGWIVDRMFIDEAVEGSREDREQFQEMMSLSRQDVRLVDGIAVWSFSRFARDQLDSQFYKAELRKRGYVIVSKIDDVPSGEMAPIYEAFIDWKNQRFLEDLSADVKRGLNFTVEQGYWPGGVAPRGYRTEKEVFGRKRNGEARYGLRLVKDESLAERVALAWQMKLRDNASYEQIHQATRIYSNHQHYSTFFSNLMYAGVFVYHGKRYPADWESGHFFCEPYVSLDDFMRVQVNRQQREFTTTSPRVLASHFLLSGLVTCGHCLQGGQKVTVTARVDKRRPDTSWYVCGVKLRQRGQDCTLPRVPCWLLEEAIVDSLISHALTPEYVMREVTEAQRQLDERRPHLDAEIAHAEQEAAEQEAAVRQLLKLIQKQGLSPVLEDEYERANKQHAHRVAQINALRNEAKQMQPLISSDADVQRYVRDIRSVLLTGETHARQELLRRFVRGITLYADHAELEYTFRLPTLVPLGGFGGVDSPTQSAPTAARTPVYGFGGHRSVH